MGTNDIDGSIKELSKWRKELNYDNGDYFYGGDSTRHSLDTAIDIMCKYQRIEQIMTEWENSGLIRNQLYDLIKEVVENGQNIIEN